MARLRNRITKATYWTDSELLRWPRDKRTTYKGLWAMAEDSGCLEDDPFEWKLVLWPSPVDADITVELLEQWRDELVKAGKLIPYEADGKRYVYVVNFHQHEKPRNPQAPDLPLPAWVRYETQKVQRSDGRTNTINVYEVDTDSVPTCYRLGTESSVLSCPVRSGPAEEHMSTDSVDAPAPDRSVAVFDHWRTIMGKNGATTFDDARKRRVRWALKTYGFDDCIAAIDGCAASDFHMGRDPKAHGKNNDLTLIFRDAMHTEKFRDNGKRKSLCELVDEEWGSEDA